MSERTRAYRVMARGLTMVLLACAAAGFQPGRWLAAAAGAAETTAEEELQRGIEHYNKGEYEQALEVLGSASGAEASRQVRRDALLYSGFALIDLGRSEEGEERFRQALELDPTLRLDPALYPPPLTEPFERVRRAFIERSAPSVVTVTQGQVYLSPPEKKPSFEFVPWYKKWWVWGLAGIAVAGAAVAAGGGGGGGTAYAAPTVKLDVTTSGSGNTFCPGDIAVAATITNGEAPFDLTWYLTIEGQARQALMTESISSRSASYTYTGLTSSGPCVNHTLEIGVVDKRNNGGRNVSDGELVRVCFC